MTAAGRSSSGRGVLARLIVTGFGTGYLPVAPGTWGSAAVCGIFLAVAWVTRGRQHCVTGTMALLAVAATITCGRLGRFCESAFGRKDPRQCTLDEWAGQALALCFLPLGPTGRGWLAAAGVAFVAFRVFDIVKPPPVRQLERLPHGWGIVADDLAAGLYANLVAQLVLRFAWAAL
ncbi:MAG TPA: phosphatidylglycerophosphatase A [Phycisphaerae bacterium]|nr:phosphatidylglycerophosphatase A [Phycisphaerae bacterium]